MRPEGVIETMVHARHEQWTIQVSYRAAYGRSSAIFDVTDKSPE